MSAYVYDGSDPAYPAGKLAYQQYPGAEAPPGFVRVDVAIPDEHMYWDLTNNVWYWAKDSLRTYARDKYIPISYPPIIVPGTDIDLFMAVSAGILALAKAEDPTQIRKVLIDKTTGEFVEMTNAAYVALVESTYGAIAKAAEIYIQIILDIDGPSTSIVDNITLEAAWATYDENYVARPRAPTLSELDARLKALESA